MDHQNLDLHVWDAELHDSRDFFRRLGDFMGLCSGIDTTHMDRTVVGGGLQTKGV
jgi:hypothetical protein